MQEQTLKVSLNLFFGAKGLLFNEDFRLHSG